LLPACRGIHPRKRPDVDLPGKSPFPAGDSTLQLAFRIACRMGSALVVSHHLDGLSLVTGCGLVASHCQPGFAAFLLWWNPPVRRPPGTHTRVLDSAFTPFEAFPSLVAVPHHCDRYLRGVRRVTARKVRLATDSRLQRSDPVGAARVRAFPPGCRPPLPKKVTRHGPPTDWHQTPLASDASSTAPHSDLLRPTAAFTTMAR